MFIPEQERMTKRHVQTNTEDRFIETEALEFLIEPSDQMQRFEVMLLIPLQLSFKEGPYYLYVTVYIRTLKSMFHFWECEVLNIEHWTYV